MLTVTGGTITPFNRDGVDYIEVLFAQSGTYSVSEDLSSHNFALAAGGANGGHGSAGWVPGGGGAGGLIEMLDVPLLAGDYTVSIGAGAPPTTAVASESNGSNSELTGPGAAHLAIGGGFGASTTVGHTTGSNGGSGGGARGASTEGTLQPPGIGSVGQGFDGGAAIWSDDPALRASGGGGGAGGEGGAAASGIAGTRGPGKLLDWIATPRVVCQGGTGHVGITEISSPDAEWGSGADPAITTTSATGGAGGDGFMFIRVRADQVNVEMAA